LAPVFTRKLLRMSMILGHPAWTEAKPMNTGFHVRDTDPAVGGRRPTGATRR